MQLTTREARKVFEKLRMREVASSHHVRGYLEVDGVRLLALHYSFGSKPFPGRTSEKFRRSMRLNQQELRQFVSCKISRDEYIAILAIRTDDST